MNHFPKGENAENKWIDKYKSLKEFIYLPTLSTMLLKFKIY